MNLTLITSDHNFIGIIRFAIAAIVVIAFTIFRHIHIIQLNSYNLDQQVIWFKKNASKMLFNVVLLISSLCYFCFGIAAFFILIVIAIFGILIENFPRKQKKKLAFTMRIKRLIAFCVVLFVPFFIPSIVTKDVYTVFYVLLAVSFSPLIIFVGFLISLPIENAFRRKFMHEAKDIIDNNKMLSVVGITGSFGKTSVKYYLDTLLKTRYNVCKTPESFNTAMGATLTIKNDLRNFDDIFICEMGARRVGDVKEICDIVMPSSCILTDVGNMHLDTFKTIDNVLKCKFELIDSVCENISDKKLIVTNGDNKLIVDRLSMYKQSGRLDGVIVRTFGFENACDFRIEDLSTGASGSRFAIVYDDGRLDIETRLLGKHNVKNLTAAIAYAIMVGVDKNDIIREVKRLEAVEHRLRLINLDTDNLLIDDAYNSNPIGARISADVLLDFTGFTKVLITPGMVELGDRQSIENEAFAKYASDKVDYALVVGKTNRSALMNGFSTLGDERTLAFDKVEEAFAYARLNIKGKKVILLENDLSDNY